VGATRPNVLLHLHRDVWDYVAWPTHGSTEGAGVMDSDLANIALICFLMGVGIVTFVGLIFAYLAVTNFLETFYLD
jgi:hypothetical protein